MVRFAPALLLALTLAAQPLLAQVPPAVPVIEVEEVALPPPIFRSHAIAMHGQPRYETGFPHFDYVNPTAPKGGTLRLGVQGTFDSFHGFIVKGVAGAGSSAAVETLMVRNEEEESFSRYGLIAESIEWPQDRSWVAFELRPEARWHDGRPITVEDVIFSFEILTSQGHPLYRNYYGSVEKVEQVGERKVRFEFSGQVNQELPLIMSELPILPKHYWQDRDFTKTTLEPPLGSGPYRVVDFEPGRFVEIERVEDYWGKDLAVNVGHNNFERIRYDYYRDASVLREAVKAGEIDLRFENSSKAWAASYDVPARRAGWLIQEKVPHEQPTGLQGYVFNTRRAIFQDPRVRRAITYAFDFEWTNKNLFFDLYTRTTSFFENSELAARGLPGPGELEILESYRGRIPEEVFTETYRVPTTDGSGWIRENLRQAFRLLDEAGWETRDMRLVNRETGQPLSFEIMLSSPAMERVTLPFIRNLKRLGIEARAQVVDTAQYVHRSDNFDFDMTTVRLGQTNSPGNEQRDYWSSKAANQPGSRNLAGISDPVVDELVDLIIAAPNRQSLIDRTRALDRLLLWGHYVIPQFHSGTDQLVVWDKFGRPPPTKRGTGPGYWWYDVEKAAALEKARKKGWPVRPDRAEPNTSVESAGEG